MRIKLAITFILAVTIISCQKADMTNSATGKGEVSFTNYTLEGTTCQWTNLDYDNKVTVINSNEDFFYYLECNGDYPHIDFTKYTLLLASGTCTYSIEDITVKKVLKEQEDCYKISIEIKINGTPANEQWQIAVLATGSCERNNCIGREISYDFEDNYFCSFVNETDIDKTTNKVEKFLNNLSNNLSNEQKLQKLVAWLNSKSCIFDATIYNSGAISFSFNENETIKDFNYHIRDRNNKFVIICTKQYAPGKVVVYTIDDVTINQTFDFINLFELEVKKITGLRNNFISDMPLDSMQYIKNFLKTKPYIDTTCGPILLLIDNKINIWTSLYYMHNEEYQTDWLMTIEDLRIVNNNSFWIIFTVPEGKEKEWVLKFNEYEFVINAELSYYFYPL